MLHTSLRWGSVAVILLAALMFTAPHIMPGTQSGPGRPHFVIPIAYFMMLAGAVGLSVGWFLKQR